ncbi:MAG TPA: DUF58 domain-containing protein [Planctomycetota bacterium]|nr:DUF58 domain-containing protein [Planctomycetota bacterium]
MEPSPSPLVPSDAARVKKRIRPTSATSYLMLVLLFVLLGAVNYQSNAAYLVLAVVTSTAVMSLLHGWRNLNGIRIEPGRTFPVFAGEPLRALVTLAGSGRERWALVVDAPEVAEDDGIPLAHLPANGTSAVELVLPGRQRGLQVLTRVRLASVHPLGLLALTVEVPAAWTWLVYPTPLGGGQDADGGGEDEQLGTRSAGTGDFNGHRPYQPGELHWCIDWRAVARGWSLLVKDYSVGGFSDGWISWEDDFIVDVEVHLSVLTGRVLAAEQHGRRYGLCLPGVTVAQDHGMDHQHACLRALALFKVTS